MQTSLTCPNFLNLFKLLKLSRSLSKSYQILLNRANNLEQESQVGEILNVKLRWSFTSKLNFTSPDQKNVVCSNLCRSRRPYGGQAKLRRYRGHHLGPCALELISLTFSMLVVVYTIKISMYESSPFS